MKGEGRSRRALRAASLLRGAGAGAFMLCLCALPRPLFGQQAVTADAAVFSNACNAGVAALSDGLYDLAEKEFRVCLAQVASDRERSAEVKILVARALYGQKKYREMLDELPRAQAGEAQFWRAMAQYGLGQYAPAVDEMRDLEAKCGDRDCRARALRLKSHCHLQMGETNKAIEAFAAVEARFSDTAEGEPNLLEWAGVLVSLNDLAQARSVLGTLLGRAGKTETGLAGRNLLARVLIRSGELQEAEKVAGEVANDENAPRDHRTSALVSLAEVRQLQGRVSDATNCLHRAAELAPSEEFKNSARVSLGLLLIKSGSLDEGSRILKERIAASPRDPMSEQLQLELASALLDGGKVERAAEEYQHYLETFTNRTGVAKAMSGRGWALLSLPEPKYAEAATLFQKAFDLYDDPADKARCLFKTADAYFLNAQYGLARETYERLVSKFPTSPLVAQAGYQIAESAALGGKQDEAEALFGRLANEGSSNVMAAHAMLRLAELKNERGQQLAALAVYERLVADYTNGPTRVSALHAHGLICYRMLRFERALEDFEKVVSLATEGEVAEQAFYMRGWCHQMMGREKEAVAVCREFARRFPGSKWAPVVAYWLGEYEFAHGRYVEAEAGFLALADAYRGDPMAEVALLRAGRAAAMQKEYLRTIEHLETLAKRYPTTKRLAQARYAQGDALSELGQFANAILIFEEVIKQNQEGYLRDSAWGRKGDCQFALGLDDPKRFEEAIASYRMVVESKTAPADLKLQAQYKIGRCLAKTDRYDEAFEQFYVRVVCAFLDEKNGAGSSDSASGEWFASAAFDAADILESRKQLPREAVRVLQRVVDSDVPAARKAQERIDAIRVKHWVLFY